MWLGLSKQRETSTYFQVGKRLSALFTVSHQYGHDTAAIDFALQRAVFPDVMSFSLLPSRVGRDQVLATPSRPLS